MTIHYKDMTTAPDAQKKRLLFVVSAPSGTGKTSLCTEVITRVRQLDFSISHTTRPPRQGEVQAKNYYFLTKKEFKQCLEENRMAEWTEKYGNYYGTAKETIQEAFNRGYDLLFDIDERGGRQLADAYPDVVTILVLPPSLAVLRNRLVDRGTDNPDAVSKRLKKATEEIKTMSWYRYVIINDTFEDAVSKLQAIIIAERCRHSHHYIEEILSNDETGKR